MKKFSFFLMAMLISLVSFAQDAPVYELKPASGSNNGYASNCDITIDGIKWNLTGNSTMQPWRIGGKSITNQDRALYSKTPLAYNIDKIEVTHGTASSITVNSFKLIISNEANGAGETIDVAFKASATTTIDLPEGDYTNKYFKFLYNVTVSGDNNKYVQFTGAKFYAALADDAVKAPIIKGSEDFISEAEVTIEAEDDVTVYYTLDGTDPTTASTAYTAPFKVTETTTVKAIAYKGENASFVTSATFTKATQVTAAEAAELAMKVASNNALTSVTYVIYAYVTNVIDQTLSSGQQRFWVADTKDGGQVLQSYYCNVPQVLKVGDYIQMFGKLTKYNTSPQMKNGDVTILPAPVVNHTIIVAANPVEGGTVTGGGEFEETDEITVKAVANEGYEFTCWTEGTDTVSTDAEYGFEVLADRNLVANFEKAAPATETVYFINTKKWSAVTVHAWDGKAAGTAWPGLATVKEAEQIAGYDVYSFTAKVGDYAKVIFNNNGGGSQTTDLVWTAGKYYVMDMGWLTKEEAETKLAAPLPEVWTIVGAAGLMGKDWDLNAAENAMTKQEDGTYKLEKKGITIKAGTYEYKAAKDHGWTVAVPQDGNQKLTISKSGVYDVTFVLNVTAKKLTATTTLKKEAVVIPTIVIAGDMNSWSTTKDKFTMSADSLTATFKTTLAVKNYGFKMVIGGNWQSDGKTITRAANSTKFTGANGDNSTLNADIAGEYTFTWTFATNTLVVTYPELPAGPVEIVGVVKRALQLGDTTIVLTHEADGTPHIYTVAGEAIAEVSQEGIVAKDPDNAGDYLTISDIALTEDGKLVACNYVRNQFEDKDVDAGYKRGTLHLYVWHDIKGAASIWFESLYTGNSLRGDCGYTMAVNGTVANANILVSAVHNSHRGFRMSHYTVIDGAYVEPNYANQTFNNHLFYVGAKFKGASAGKDAATFNEATHGVNFQLNASPLAENNWVIDSEGLMPTEFGVAAQQDPSIVGAVAETLVSKTLVGAYYVTVGEKKVMVAPYADAEGKLAGVKLLDITAGFANAALLTTAESLDLTAPVAATGVATTAVVESNGSLTINLIADATIHTMTATIQAGPSTNLENNNVQNDIIKFYQNGQIYIMINGAVYNVMGQMVK